MLGPPPRLRIAARQDDSEKHQLLPARWLQPLAELEVHHRRVLLRARRCASPAPRLGLVFGSVLSRELRSGERTGNEVMEMHCEQLGTISSAYGLVLVSRTTAVELAVRLYVTRSALGCLESCYMPRPPPVR